MTAKSRPGKSRPHPEKSGGRARPAAVTAPPSPAGASAAAEAPPEKLTPEEQMERFAKELKNEDWGHQPC